jgi:leucyl-tRNA synthetase
MRGFNTLLPMAFHYTGTPILAMSKRVAEGDEEVLNDFVSIYGVQPEVVKSFADPLTMAQYFHEEIKQGMKKMGYSIDWRREFTTVDPQYNRFIEWQFKKLRERGLISKGSHAVGWCPKCGNPVGQHDTKGDVEPEIGEFVLIKFSAGRSLIPTATLRPETVFGVTNLWLKPNADYVKVKVSDEVWIISEECAKKLGFLGREVEVLGKISPEELIGKHVTNPVTGQSIPIFPAEFVDPGSATGIVMSVPAHAPYDYAALTDLKEDRDMIEKFGIEEDLARTKPISIIELTGFSETPAADLIQQYNIEGQNDPNLEKATKDLYTQEFHRGSMKSNTGRYSGMRVLEARDAVKRDLLAEEKADVMYELLNRPVFCRCGAECLVKIFEDQWFINYGSREWKDLARDCLASMKIVPDLLRSEFEYTIDWLRERACARKRGLGTKLPWDPSWIIESLSDSVIYMCYYLISKYIRQHDIKADQLTDDVFDYVFLGVGDPEQIGREVELDPDILKAMASEVRYFYPLDSRNSGRDLVPNHLTFFIFNHVAIFPEELWPRQIVVNGSVLMEGKKMSKSLGNIVPLRKAIEKYGADPLRLSILATAEVLQDADFSHKLAESVKEQLERFYSTALDTIEMREEVGEASTRSIDRWMLSRIELSVKAVTEALEDWRIREAVQVAFFSLNRDLHWYMRRVKADLADPARRRAIANVLNKALRTRVKLLAPFAPHLCEEIWQQMGEEGFVSSAPWPTYDEAKVDVQSIKQEELVKSVVKDTSEIMKVRRVSPKRICYYVATDWKWEAYMKALKMAEKGSVDVGELMRRWKGKFVKKVAESVRGLTSEVGGRRSE